MVIFSIIYFVVLGFSLYLQSLLSKKVICKLMLQIRSDVFRGTINHNIEDFEKKNTADYISVVTNDVKMLEDNFLIPLFEVVQYTVVFISSFVLMIYFDIISYNLRNSSACSYVPYTQSAGWNTGKKTE